MVNLSIEKLTTKAFENANLKITKPGLYGIIGRNGAGKSTLFTAINGEMRFNGSISVEDAMFSGRVAYVPTLDIFDDNLRASDYIGVLKNNELKSAKKFMAQFSTDRFFYKPIKEYSLGMKEILGFIYSVSIEADVIIIDELMNGLDHTMRDTAYKILKTLAKTHIVLLTSHILEEIERNCNKVYFLSSDGFKEVKNFEEAKKKIIETDVFI